MNHCKRVLLAAGAALILTVAATAVAREATASTTAPTSTAAPAGSAPPPAAAAQAPRSPAAPAAPSAASCGGGAGSLGTEGPHPSPDAATESYLAQLSPAARARSDAYFEGGYWLILWDFLTGLAVAWLFLGTGLSRRIRDLAESITHWRWLQTALYAACYIVISTLVLLPWEAYEGYFREHQYGMSNQDLGAWLGDQAKGLVVGLVLGIPALLIIYAVLRRAPRTWWLWGALAATVLTAFAVAIAPVYVDPIFNRIKPLAESPLKRQILSMARANAIPASDVYEYDASKQTKRMSAHVSGLFGTTRISMNDNLLNRGTPEEIEAVLGHEMGHYVLHHVYKGMVFIAIGLVAGFACMRWAFDRLQAAHGWRWGTRGVGDVAALPLLIVLLSAYLFVLTPATNTLTRTMEAEADAFGLNAARQPDGFALAALHLSEYRKMKPGPIEEFVFFDHPSGWNRIHRAMVWKAEHLADADIAAYDAAHPAAPRPDRPGR